MGNDFFKGDMEVFKAARNKLFATNEKQINNYTLTLDTLHSCMSVLYTYQWRGVLRNIFWYGCYSLLIFVAKKVAKGSELQFLCTQGTLQGGRLEDHRMMFTRHLHLTQSYVQAILYIYKTDYMKSLITVHILYAPRICWQK